jgi:L-asparaginase/Glu-tRNA(Gln) amidotransferase subunit D
VANVDSTNIDPSHWDAILAEIEGDRATKVSESKLDAFETVNDRVFGEIRTHIRYNSRELPRRHATRTMWLLQHNGGLGAFEQAFAESRPRR